MNKAIAADRPGRRRRTLKEIRAILVVVNCAGRTRSIIGAQSLINAGLPNRVVALVEQVKREPYLAFRS